MASLQNPADVVNAALVKIGYQNLIGNLRDGSKAANKALTIYGETRDTMMRGGDWGFALRNVPLTLLKQAPANLTYLTPWTDQYPPIPWQFEYDYPDDMLRLRSVKPTPVFIPDMDPQPYTWSIYNDTSYTPNKRVILCNAEAAIASYAARVTDPATWPNDFTSALIDMLGEALAAGLTTPAQEQLAAAEGQRDTQAARMVQG